MTNPCDEMDALRYVIARLARRFPFADDALICDLVADEFVDFDGARLRAYVPVLVEARVVRRLSSLGLAGVSGAGRIARLA